MSNEAHLSAEQARARAAARLPGAERDGRWPQGPGGAAGARAQAPFRVGSRFKGSGFKLERVTRRADYLAANQALRAPMPGFVLLVRPRGDGGSMRIGITVSSKVGNAVTRNRMKRRFRELARLVLPEAGVPSADHILIGRVQGIERDYSLLEAELRKALAKLASKLASRLRPDQ